MNQRLKMNCPKMSIFIYLLQPEIWDLKSHATWVQGDFVRFFECFFINKQFFKRNERHLWTKNPHLIFWNTIWKLWYVWLERAVETNEELGILNFKSLEVGKFPFKFECTEQNWKNSSKVRKLHGSLNFLTLFFRISSRTFQVITIQLHVFFNCSWNLTYDMWHTPYSRKITIDFCLDDDVTWSYQVTHK